MGSVGTEVSRQQATRRVMPICSTQAPRWFPGRRGTAHDIHVILQQFISWMGSDLCRGGGIGGGVYSVRWREKLYW